MLAVDPAGTFFVAGDDRDPNGHLASELMVTSRPAGGALRPVQYFADGKLSAHNLAASPSAGALLACMCYRSGEATALWTRTVGADGTVGPLTHAADWGGSLFGLALGVDG